MPYYGSARLWAVTLEQKLIGVSQLAPNGGWDQMVPADVRSGARAPLTKQSVICVSLLRLRLSPELFYWAKLSVVRGIRPSSAS